MKNQQAIKDTLRPLHRPNSSLALTNAYNPTQMRKYIQLANRHAGSIKKDIWQDPLNSGKKLKFTANYIRWNLFHKYKDKKWQISFDNGLVSMVYPYPDHDAGEINIWTRNVDYHDLQFIRKHLNKGETIVDAGCNVGNRTLAVADLLSSALLIDAGAVAVERTRENMALNNLDPEKFKVIRCAVGESEGMVSFTDEGGASTHNRVTNDASVKTVQVPMRTIDNLVKEHGLKPSFIKLDVEGFDFAAIKGSINTLKSGTVRLIKFEHFREEPVEPINEFFNSIDWVLFTLDAKGNPVRDAQLLQENLNLFAAPKSYYSGHIA